MEQGKNKARVVKIISNKQLVINKGTDDQIKKGDQFIIISKKKGDPVKDPETGKVLGYLDAIKAHVVVTYAYPNMSIVEPPVHYINGLADNLLNMSRIPKGAVSQQFEGHSEQEALNVDPSQITGDIEESDDPSELGDFAVKN